MLTELWDSTAAVITAVAIHQSDTAEIHKSINEEAAEKMINDTYVDDITTGTDFKDEIPALNVTYLQSWVKPK